MKDFLIRGGLFVGFIESLTETQESSNLIEEDRNFKELHAVGGRDGRAFERGSVGLRWIWSFQKISKVLYLKVDAKSGSWLLSRFERNLWKSFEAPEVSASKDPTNDVSNSSIAFDQSSCPHRRRIFFIKDNKLFCSIGAVSRSFLSLVNWNQMTTMLGCLNYI